MKAINIAKVKDESGEIMLETSIILVAVIILLFALLSMSFMFYQETMMTSIASEIATEVAQNYKYTHTENGGRTTLEELDNDEISLSNVRNVKMFRLSLARDVIKDAQVERAKSYGEWRLALSTLGLNSGDLNVDCEIIGSGIGRAFVIVTVSQQSDFFLSGFLDMLGITNNGQLFQATAYAECVDLMGYTSMSNFTEYVCTTFHAFNAFGSLYGSIKSLLLKFV